jgi:hypothetical protein
VWIRCFDRRDRIGATVRHAHVNEGDVDNVLCAQSCCLQPVRRFTDEVEPG